ncbi:Polysaccharide deacetylase [uncultured Paludibacter sp.]|nr:Polysaccharide deacetylase [uncultured Paludibacter sp.]
MKKILNIYILTLISCISYASSWIRVNQIGYLENDIKVAVWISKENKIISRFQIIDDKTGKIVYSGTKNRQTGKQHAFESSARLDFSNFTIPGTYKILTNDAVSEAFKIGNDIYFGAADIPLKYMRQQRCGFNPYLKDSCHTHDGITVGDPEGKRDGKYYNTIGGWHDASDYLQYVTTSANAVYQMLFAYNQYPEVFGDYYQANGLEGKNGIPDILDEAKWGLDWLARMNPDSATYFNQLADDRDHAGMILPPQQKVDYGWGTGKERPVYFCSPKPQGLRKYKNRSTGLASTLGKYASSFSLGAKTLEKYYPEFAEMLKQKAKDAYKKGTENPGACQTASCVSPYFYEEDNWADDMQLAASEIYSLSGNNKFLMEAVNYGRLEPITPWMGADSAKHYQWYPFINLGKYQTIIQNTNSRTKAEFIRNMKSELQRVKDRAGNDAFMNGIPFIWCSNNLTVAFITECRLYNELTNDDSFLEIETAMRDWLFGCNPWGTSMIIGYPENGDFPSDPHSAFTHLHQMPITGGLVDGPIYSSIFQSLKGVHLTKDDTYAEFQSDYVVYHDDFADYSSNEPTMDGTASLTYYLGYLNAQATKKKEIEGGIIRGNPMEKKIALVFTGHEFADGAKTISNTLKKNNIKGSFFLTGDFYRKYSRIAKKLQEEGNYMGPHSDKHLLYNDWTKRDSTIISKEKFEKDLSENYEAMEKAGLKIDEPRYFIPPYEWYNNQIADWGKEMGVKIINFTPGTGSNADYTTPDMKNYRSSEIIYNNILKYEEEQTLNGCFLLLHIGTDPKRTDKFYNRLYDLVKEMKIRGYEFIRVDDMMNN